MGKMNDVRFAFGSETIFYLKDSRQVSGVSRWLQTKDRALDSVVFMQGRPILDSEINLLQGVMSRKFHDLSAVMLENGYVDAIPSGVDSNDATRATFGAFTYLFNGYLLTIDDSNGYVNVNMGPKIQQATRRDTIALFVYKEEVAAPGENTEYREQLKLHGNLNGADVPSDLIDPALPDGLPTTRRVQISYRVGAISGDSLVNISGVNTDGQIVQGYVYTNDGNMYRVGDGTEASARALGTVDGYAYMIPLFLVDRAIGDTGINAAQLINQVIPARFKLKVSGTSIYVTQNPGLFITGNNLNEVLTNMSTGFTNLIMNMETSHLAKINQSIGVQQAINGVLEQILAQAGG